MPHKQPKMPTGAQRSYPSRSRQRSSGEVTNYSFLYAALLPWTTRIRSHAHSTFIPSGPLASSASPPHRSKPRQADTVGHLLGRYVPLGFDGYSWWWLLATVVWWFGLTTRTEMVSLIVDYILSVLCPSVLHLSHIDISLHPPPVRIPGVRILSGVVVREW